MMEPLSTLSIVTAITQFLSFSSEALKLCKEIRDDVQGATAANKALEESTREFRELAKDVKTAAGQDAASKRVERVANQCNVLSDDLLKLLKEVRSAGRQRPSMAKLTFKAMKGKRKIEKLQNAVEKQQVLLHNVLSHDIRTQLLAVREAQHKTDTVLTVGLQKTNETLDSQQRIVEQVVELRSYIGEQFDRLRPPLYKEYLKVAVARQQLMRTLFFADLGVHQLEITLPVAHTFQWIMNEHAPPVTASLKGELNFPSWLREEQNSIFWISGKAGSGKSTLMSYILKHKSIQRQLKIWANGRPLHMIGYFANYQIERNASPQGLLRTVLYQLLDAIPCLTVPPLLLQLHGEVWTETELRLLLDLVLRSPEAQQRCFCILLDGLDEVDEFTDDHLKMILSLEYYLNVKCCVSARPWSIFARRLGRGNRLVMQDLTKADIDSYVKSSFESYGMSHLMTSEVMSEIHEKACGVFLWVVLVMQVLQRGMHTTTDLHDFRAQLSKMPSELNKCLEMWPDISLDIMPMRYRLHGRMRRS